MPPDVTFSRASSSGGYYDGKTVVKAEENLLTYSQEFDNAAWVKNNVAVTSNTTTAPDGTVTADTLTASSTTAATGVYQTPSRALGDTGSVYAKAGNVDFISIEDAGGTVYAKFNINTGTVVGSANCTASIVAAPNGFFRCIASNASAAPNIHFAVSVQSDGTNQPSWGGANTTSGSFVYIWAAQAEKRDSVTAYTPTTTQPITRYQPKMLFAPADVPVFDHDPVTGEAKGLAIWESRTNLLLRSQEFDNAVWTKTRSTISANKAIAPDGTLTADKLVESTDVATSHLVGRFITGLTTTAYTLTVYAKAAERSQIVVVGSSASTYGYIFDLSTGAGIGSFGVAPNSFSITSVGNGWYRCSITYTQPNTEAHFRLYPAVGGNASYDGDGFSGIYIWQADLQAGSFASPPIPTTAATVTRAADVAVMTGANFSRWYRADEGTFVVEANSVAGASARSTIRATDSDASDIVEILMVTGTNNGQGRYQVNYAGVAQVDTGNISSPAFVANTFYKNAASYKVNDFAISRDGAAVVVDTVGSVPLGVDRLEMGGRHLSNSAVLNGYIKSLSYYPARLTNAQLQAVTS